MIFFSFWRGAPVWFLVTYRLVLIACLTACSVAETRALEEVDRDIDGTPVPLQAFCPLFTRAMCDAVVACRCAIASRDECVFETFDDCVGPEGLISDEVVAAIADGRIVYSETAAAALLERLARTSNTCDPLGALDWQMEDLLTLDGVLTGTLDARATCTIEWDRVTANECRDGVCGSEDSGPRVCHRVAEISEPCDDDTICIDPNYDILVNADLKGRAGRCIDGLCRSASAEGVACSKNRDCSSSRCDNSVCLASIEAGAPCTRDIECGTSFCDDGRCGARDREFGAACDFNGDCSDGVCARGECAPAICSGYGPPPT